MQDLLLFVSINKCDDYYGFVDVFEIVFKFKKFK